MIENKKNYEQFDQDMFTPVEMNEQLGERIAGKSLNFWQDAWMRLKKNKAAIISLSIILILVALALFGPMLSSRDAYEQNISQAKLSSR